MRSHHREINEEIRVEMTSRGWTPQRLAEEATKLRDSEYSDPRIEEFSESQMRRLLRTRCLFLAHDLREPVGYVMRVLNIPPDFMLEAFGLRGWNDKEQRYAA